VHLIPWNTVEKRYEQGAKGIPIDHILESYPRLRKTDGGYNLEEVLKWKWC
jgi:hypothetical protein